MHRHRSHSSCDCMLMDCLITETSWNIQRCLYTCIYNYAELGGSEKMAGLFVNDAWNNSPPDFVAWAFKIGLFIILSLYKAFLEQTICSGRFLFLLFSAVATAIGWLNSILPQILLPSMMIHPKMMMFSTGTSFLLYLPTRLHRHRIFGAPHRKSSWVSFSDDTQQVMLGEVPYKAFHWASFPSDTSQRGLCGYYILTIPPELKRVNAA